MVINVPVPFESGFNLVVGRWVGQVHVLYIPPDILLRAGSPRFSQRSLTGEASVKH